MFRWRANARHLILPGTRFGALEGKEGKEPWDEAGALRMLLHPTYSATYLLDVSLTGLMRVHACWPSN